MLYEICRLKLGFGLEGMIRELMMYGIFLMGNFYGIMLFFGCLDSYGDFWMYIMFIVFFLSLKVKV